MWFLLLALATASLATSTTPAPAVAAAATSTTAFYFDADFTLVAADPTAFVNATLAALTAAAVPTSNLQLSLFADSGGSVGVLVTGPAADLVAVDAAVNGHHITVGGLVAAPAAPVSTASPMTTADGLVCSLAPVDLVFLLDTSGSMNETDLQHVLQFASKIVLHLPVPVGPDPLRDSRVAAISFDSVAVEQFDFLAYNSSAQASRALLRITPSMPAGSTATHAALNKLRGRLLSSDVAPPSGWRNLAVPTLVVIVTDGLSSETASTAEAIQALNDAYNSSVARFAVGVNSYDPTELLALAQDEPSHVLQLADFVGLDSSYAKFLRGLYCVPPTTASPTTASPATLSPSTHSPASHSPTTHSPFTVSPMSQSPTTADGQVCNFSAVDLAFVLDTSGSLSADDLHLMLQFTAKIVQHLPAAVGPDPLLGSRVAAINFDSTAVVQFEFNTFNSSAAVSEALLNISRLNKDGATDTHLALNKLRARLLTHNAGWRALTVPTLVIFVTDGVFSSPQETAAALQAFNDAYNSSVTRFAVGVGSYNQTELLALTNHVAANVLELADFGLLDVNYYKFLRSLYCYMPTTVSPTTNSPTSISLTSNSPTSNSPTSESPTSRRPCADCAPGYFAGEVGCAQCQPGSFCPGGSESLQPCPNGTFGSESGAASVDACQPCPVNFFCPHDGLAVPYPCPTGSRSDSGAATCTVCPAGFSCSNGFLIPCVAGYFAPAGAATCEPCPRGHACANASLPPSRCGSGQLSLQPASVTCNTCPSAHFCAASDEPPQPCEPGFFAAQGQEACQPCPPGSSCFDAIKPTLCVPGTASAGRALNCTPCLAGSLAPDSGAENCSVCTAGTYCLVGAAAPSGLCDPGYFCPAGSASPQARPCASGTHRALPGARSAAQCAPCPPGTFCPTASVDPAPCPLGFFCPNGTALPQPCPMGTLGLQVGLAAAADCLPCPPGRFCAALNLTTAATSPFVDDCSPGFLCVSGAASPTPAAIAPAAAISVGNASFANGPCPPGFWCGRGASIPQACPAGTYSPQQGLVSAAGCIACPAGRYCEPGAAAPTGFCQNGYFCDGSATNATQHATPAGFFSGTGASAPSPCAAGEVQPLPLQSACEPCPGRYVCLDRSQAPQICPANHFCPASTGRVPPLCPPGSFSNATGLLNASECLPCPAGFWCVAGVIQGLCEAGYVCARGSGVPNPAGSCRLGAYCPAGTTAAVSCGNTSVVYVMGSSNAECANSPGASSFSLSAGTSFADCRQCPPRYLCDVPEMRPCPAGFSCPGGGAGAVPCPAGSYCPAAVAAPVPCPAGSFGQNASALNASVCAACPPGFFCEQGGAVPTGRCKPGFFCSSGARNDTQFPVPPGYYASAGSSAPTACPANTFNALGFGTSLAACLLCPNNSYSDAGAAQCTSCGPHATLNVATRQCVCTGRFRVFSPLGQACICQTNYRARGQDSPLVAGSVYGSGASDCQPLVHPGCLEQEFRASDTGECRTVAAWAEYCVGACAAHGGAADPAFDTALGRCMCAASALNLDSVCDASCRAAESQRATLQCPVPATGSALLHFTTRNNSVATSSASNLNAGRTESVGQQPNLGALLCPANRSSSSSAGGTARRRATIVESLAVSTPSYSLYLMVGSAAGYAGAYNVTLELWQAIVGPGNAAWDPLLARSLILLPNPVTCLQHSDVVVFAVTPTQYPQFAKDDLFNFQADALVPFDFAPLEALRLQQQAVNASPASWFAFAFVAPGVWVLADSGSGRRMIFVVQAPGVPCPEPGPFFPASRAYLTLLGVTANRLSLVVQPHWELVGILIGAGILLCFTLLLWFWLGSWWVAHGDVARAMRPPRASRAQEADPMTLLLGTSKLAYRREAAAIDLRVLSTTASTRRPDAAARGWTANAARMPGPPGVPPTLQVGRDAREDSLVNAAGARPLAVPADGLSNLEFAVVRFGAVVQQVLGERLRVPVVTVAVARDLPTDHEYAQNYYGRSYFFDAETSQLFIRRERLASVGEFALVLVHALAHYHAGPQWDHDLAPAVAEHLHHFMQCVCHELFALYTAPGLARSSNVDVVRDVEARPAIHESTL